MVHSYADLAPVGKFRAFDKSTGFPLAGNILWRVKAPILNAGPRIIFTKKGKACIQRISELSPLRPFNTTPFQLLLGQLRQLAWLFIRFGLVPITIAHSKHTIGRMIILRILRYAMPIRTFAAFIYCHFSSSFQKLNNNCPAGPSSGGGAAGVGSGAGGLSGARLDTARISRRQRKRSAHGPRK